MLILGTKQSLENPFLLALKRKLIYACTGEAVMI